MSEPNIQSVINALALCKCCTPTEPADAFNNFTLLYKAFENWNPGSAFSSKQMRTKYWKGLIDAAAENDAGKARELWNEMETEQQKEVWGDLSSGIRSAIKELLDSTKEKAA